MFFLLLPRAPSTPWTPCISPAPWSRRGSAPCLPRLSHFQVGWEQPPSQAVTLPGGLGKTRSRAVTAHSAQMGSARTGVGGTEHSHQPAPGSGDKLMCFIYSQLLACISNTLFKNETMIFRKGKCFLAKQLCFFFFF